jgi:transposase
MQHTKIKLALTLLPTGAGLGLDQVVVDGHAIVLQVRSTAPSTLCPECRQPTRRVHSRYRRTVADLPWGGYTVRLRLRVRRFRCAQAGCRRRVFAERLPAVVAPSARRTARAQEILALIGLHLGGEAGARVVARLGIGASPSTLLRALRRGAPAPRPAPRVVGIDDFAFRRGRAYGTVVVDLEEGAVVDLLPDRAAATVARWLRANPQVGVIARDRSGEYARAAAEAAPAAVQVADRWHLLKNLSEALERLLDRKQRDLRGVVLGATAPPRLPRSPSDQAVRRARRAQRLTRYADVCALREQGLGQRAIARRLRLHRSTVRRFLAADAFPERAPHPLRPSMLDPYEPHLDRRWAEGCRNGLQLWRELRERGYPGSRKLVARWVQQRRSTPAPTTPTTYRNRPRPAPGGDDQPTSAAGRRASSRQLVWLLVRDPERLTAAEHAALTAMREACREIDAAYPLVREFVRMIRERTPEALGPWFAAVAAAAIPDLRTFAAGLRRDERAVVAALTLPWSNGQTEGHVNKLKLLKRQMYGRGSFGLLRHRLLAA